MQKRVAMRLREIRNDTIWINGEDVAMSFKPMKMGLRMANLDESWSEFTEKYMRVKHTFEELYSIKMKDEEIKQDLEWLKQLQSITKEHKLIQDTVVLINKQINEGKRVLVEDCSSSSMDIDYGIYPYVDSFSTTTGQVCTGLGVPEEAIETTIGVFSATAIIRKAFLNRIQSFPTQISEKDESAIYQNITKNFKEKYQVDD